MNGVSDTSFANETHQLLVSISRHLYVTKSGVVKYQEKPMTVDIGNFYRSKKEHLVYYVLRDVFSGNFIFAVVTTQNMLPLLDFLYFGWKKDKEEDHFWGLPQRLSVPKRISSPELIAGLQHLGVEPFHPSSGFASGMRILRDLEENLCCYALGRSAIHSLATVQKCKSSVYQFILEDTSKINRINLWRNSLPPGYPREAPDYETFKGFFPVPGEDKPGLPLFGFPAGGNATETKPRLPDFLDSPIENKKFSPEKLAKAQKLIYETDGVKYRDTMLHKAYEALNCSPYCVDAYNLLADESDYLDEKMALFRRAVQAGELSLGELFFKRNEGHFWGIVETRPYMRALSGLAECLWKKGQRREALDIYWEMLRLNHNDNQGIRYQLGFRLLDEERYDEMEKLFRTYNEATCFMLYNMALCRFCNDAGDADKVLHRALRSNRHVPAYLLNEEKVPYRLPDYYSPASEEEAVIYAGEAGAAWRKAAGALDWLQKNRSAYKDAEPGHAADPNIARVLQDFLEEQAGRLGKSTLGKYEFALEMLQVCLDNYGHQLLDDDEEEMLESCQESDESGEEFSFCRLFGPEKIPGMINEFLGYFMVRKVACGKDQLRVTGTAIKKLASWLGVRGYITAGEAEEMAVTAARASRDLPAADELSELLFYLVENSPPPEGDEELNDLFSVVKVEPGKLYLQAGVDKPVVIAVPREISSLCKKGWMLNLLLVKTEGGWCIAKTGGVYPI